MIIKIHRLIVQTYGELIKEKTKRLLKDIIALATVIYFMFTVGKYTEGLSFSVFDVQYRLDIILFYLISFIFIITASAIFLDLKNFMNIATRFIITRFPKMDREFGPGKMIVMDLVQITAAFLVFKPLSLFLSGIEIDGYLLVQMVSVSFLVLALVFAYDILVNIIKILKCHFETVANLFTRLRDGTKNGQ